MSRTRMARTVLAGVSILSLCAAHAAAQSVDYSSLEQMFGEPITTSVTGSPQRVSEAPAAMSIVTQDDIRRSGADNLPDVLQFVTGLDVRRTSFGEAEVSVRGYDQAFNPRLLVLVNGRQVYQDDYGQVNWNAIPVQLGEIRQVEIVKGPNSALFGFNAASGVINIITYDPLLDSTNEATLRGGTQHLGEGEAVTTVHLGKNFGARFSIGGYTAEDFAQPPATGGVDAPSPRNGRMNLEAKWQLTDKIQLRAQASLVDSRYNAWSPFGSFSPGDSRTNDLLVGGSAETRIGEISLDAYRNGIRNVFGSFANRIDAANVTRVVKLSDLLKVGTSNTFRVGLEYRNNLDTSATFYSGTVSYDDYAASLMWDHSFSQKLTLVNAVRLDYLVLHDDAAILPFLGHESQTYNNTTLTAPSFNSGITYALTPKDTLRLTAARGLQVPSLIDFGAQDFVGIGYVEGSPTLSPTAVWNLDLGYDRDAPSVLSHITVDAFLQRNTDLVAAPGEGPILVQSHAILLTIDNEGSSNEAGVEAGIKGKSANGLRWNASYRFSAISEDLTSALPPGETSNFARGTPMNNIIAGIGYSIGQWEFDLNGRWQSSFTDYTEVSLAGQSPLEIGNYVTFMGRVGYNLTRNITLSGTAQQFNVTMIRESAGLPVDRRLFASVTVHL